MTRQTLKDFLLTFNFRDVLVSNENEYDHDTKVVRIYIDEEDYTWIEFGVEDYITYNKEKMIEQTLKPELLDRIIDTIDVNDTGTVEIYLDEAIEEDKDITVEFTFSNDNRIKNSIEKDCNTCKHFYSISGIQVGCMKNSDKFSFNHRPSDCPDYEAH